MRIVAADTETSPHDFDACASRQTLMSGAAVKQAGEEVVAEILDFPEVDLDVRSIRDHIKQKMADFKLPNEMVVLTELPRMPRGLELKDASLVAVQYPGYVD
jgi:acyl-CoA synthetase (AMP-forming)/AMP-acid ligase II